VDWAYRVFDRSRSELVAALASDEVLRQFNDLGYGTTRSYHPDSPSFRAYLFPWEQKAIDEFFARPPAHVLVGGAGGGREALALVDMGYRVTAFEPSDVLSSALARQARRIDRLAVYRGRYEDLPTLTTLDGGPEVNLEGLGPFDAVIVGWGSFSHLRTDRLRVATLESLARLTSGPIVISFLGIFEAGGTPSSIAGRLRRALPRRRGRVPGDMFSTSIGFYHRTNHVEVAALAATAGLGVVHASFDERDTNWPHVVLQRR
jgi:hypothetical protein